MTNLYSKKASKTTPASIIFLLDASASMGNAVNGTPKNIIVRNAFKAVLKKFTDRSMKGTRLSPRYRLAIIAYSDQVEDLTGGFKPINYIQKQGASLLLHPQSTTLTAEAFKAAERLLEQELSTMYHYPAPVVCHLTDGKFNGEDPTPVAKRIAEMSVEDGKVLIENIFISDEALTEPIRNPMIWPGITSRSQLSDDYARTLWDISSVLPESYRLMINESGFKLQKGARMMLPGALEQLVALGFAMSGST